MTEKKQMKEKPVSLFELKKRSDAVIASLHSNKIGIVKQYIKSLEWVVIKEHDKFTMLLNSLKMLNSIKCENNRVKIEIQNHKISKKGGKNDKRNTRTICTQISR